MRTAYLGIFIGALLISMGPAVIEAQESSQLFVVYGYLYQDVSHNIPVNGGYSVSVWNETKNKTLSVPVSSGIDAGKFCAVFINFSGSAVSEGDCISISLYSGQAAPPGDAAARYLLSGNHYCVTAADVRDMKVMIEIELSTIGTDPSTWGAIKSLFS